MLVNIISFPVVLPSAYLVVDLINDLMVRLEVKQVHLEVWWRLDVSEDEWIEIHRFVVAVHRQSVIRRHRQDYYDKM